MAGRAQRLHQELWQDRRSWASDAGTRHAPVTITQSSLRCQVVSRAVALQGMFTADFLRSITLRISVS